MKPVNLNQLLFHPQSTTTLSFFRPRQSEAEEIGPFLQDMQLQLSLRGKPALAKILNKNKSQIKKILKTHPDKALGFFLSEKIQGYILLETAVENYCMIGNSFHVRPLLEELFVNPEYLVVNVSLYDINVYRGDFHHLEIIKHYEFDKLAIDLRSRVFTPNHLGLVPYKSILALKNIAQQVMDLSHYNSMPVLVTGLDHMKGIFLRSLPDPTGVISHMHEDFYEKTCVEILDRCKQFRYAVMDYYSVRFKERLKKMVKDKRLVSDLGQIVESIRRGKVIQLVLPTQKKVFGKIDFHSGTYEIHRKELKKKASQDILNELAEEVIRQGGKIQILPPHFFPQDSYVLAILKG